MLPICGYLVLLAAPAIAQQPMPAAVRDAYIARNLGLARLETMQLDDAQRQFEALVRAHPGDALGHANLAVVALRRPDAKGAQKHVREARRIAPDRADIALLEVNILAAAGDAEGALAAAEAALNEHPHDAKLLYAMATLLDAQRDPHRRAELLAMWRALHAEAPENVLPIVEGLVIAAQEKAWDAVRELVAALRAAYYMPPERVEKGFADLTAAAEGDASLERKAYTAALAIRNVLRSSRRHKRDAELLRLPPSLGGGEPIEKFTAPELDGAWEAAGGRNQIHLLATEPVALEVAGLVRGVRATVGDLDDDGIPEAAVWAGAARPAAVIVRIEAGDAGWTPAPRPLPPLPVEGEYALLFSRLLDLDNDRDLDLVVVTRSEGAGGAGGAGGARLWLIKNEGGALMPPVGSAATFPDGTLDVFQPGDFDHDGDLDLAFFVGDGDGAALHLLVNNLDGTHDARPMNAALEAQRPLAACALDANLDLGLDLVVRTTTGLVLLTNNLDSSMTMRDLAADLAADAGAVAFADFAHDGSPDLVATGPGMSLVKMVAGDPTPAQALGPIADEILLADFDNDGTEDMLTVYEGDAQLSRTIGRMWEAMDGESRSDMTRPVAADLDADGDLDLISFDTSKDRVHLHRNDGGNANKWLQLRLRGRTSNDQKNNFYALGSSVELKAGDLYARTFVTSDVAHFGLGQRERADVVRIVWTNGSPQNLFEPVASQRLDAEQIILGSCPSVYGWDGEKFVFVTDVLWRTALGMYIMKDTYAHHATSADHFLLPGAAMVPRDDGRLVVQFVMDLWETAYLDEVRLAAIDHPADVDVRVNEVCVAPPYPPFAVYAIAAADRIGLARATDATGADHAAALAARDRAYVVNFTPTPYQGIADAHDLVLVPERWPSSPAAPFHLFLNGWLYPTDASINVALAQNGAYDPAPPVVEALGADGRWVEVARPGFPAGKYKTIVVDLTGRLPEGAQAVRVATNFMIYWDEAFFAERADAPHALTYLPAPAADLHFRGFHRMEWENGLGPLVFDYDDVTAEPRWVGQSGRYTRYGDVGALVAARDDRYVVTGSGEETTLAFDPAPLPPLPDGWRRDYILFTDGWLKDGNLNSLTGQTSEPMPHSAMTAFPPLVPAPAPADGTLTRERTSATFRDRLARP